MAEAWATPEERARLASDHQRYEDSLGKRLAWLEQLEREEAVARAGLKRQMQAIRLEIETGRPWEAIGRCWRTLERFPDACPENIAALYNKLGFSYYYLRDYWQAREMVDKAFELVPKEYSPELAWVQRSLYATFLKYKILYLCAWGDAHRAREAVRTWVHGYGYKFEWLPAPHRYALAQLGIGADGDLWED